MLSGVDACKNAIESSFTLTEFMIVLYLVSLLYSFLVLRAGL